MEYLLPLCKLCHIETRRWLFLVGVVAFTYVIFQSLLLPYGDALRSLLPEDGIQKYDQYNIYMGSTSAKLTTVRNPLTVLDLANVSTTPIGNTDNFILERGFQRDSTLNGKGKYVKEKGSSRDGYELSLNGNHDIGFESGNNVDTNGNLESYGTKNRVNNSILHVDGETSFEFPLEQQVVKPSDTITSENELEEFGQMDSDFGELEEFKTSSLEKPEDADVAFNSSTFMLQISTSPVNTSHSQHLISNISSSVSETNSKSVGKRKKMKSEMPPKSVTSLEEMNRILLRHRRSSRAMRPRRSSLRDQEIFSARSQIEQASAINDPELYTPLFRNVSMFKRSYELMERTLKIYVYRDGKKPIFHQPILKGLYASEGWFMKLMEGNKRFVVKDPRKAHLFYMPFSSRMLEYTLYVRNSHNRTNLRQFLKEYAEHIAAKYPYWNRTGGADHFLVGCHDWAPYETRHHMEHCIKALCNADVTVGFKIGRDVSLPETYVRSMRNPLRDLGGKPASQRHILAFYAGNMHGYVRPILLKYWKDKNPDMKIFGPMPPGVASKMNYIQHMKSSKYCICPKGYEVNSPRVVEAIFYECVPVIISDNFVPPFFEVLDWEAFSVIVAEKDIPNLQDILLSIPKDRYLEMQLRVRKVQKHFLWHAKPLKYDLFHMTLHSIWYNRVFQIKLR
ncbi:probable glycosyltransferase At5g03795 [Benincasa hispida]|uniref:probable glycosyltransferase At5g03795 n=1 Tax=Benincasa hispida TaxID=102211 RepID=UPI0019008666|nr:probable glycosyltransferase At5g03795 [Benincasa hispida]XP_038879147.1 probable glycosyltransferase At5g03795 [Benincasa hispida]XP_038879148.1 probable glycosyltransferase At5g03795 [Benincasa hispida]